MAISKIVQNSIDETSVSLGAKISNVQIANSSYTVLDDTAVNVGGGYIVITGSGFKESAQVLIGSNTACSVSVIDSTTIRAEVPAKDAGTYPVYVVNTDGGVGIRVPGLTYSGFPTWVTDSTLPEQGVDEPISIQLEATGANTYALQTGSTLPSGMVLNTANGLLTGTVTGISEETLYNFTIEAIDTENQESPRAFNVTITVGDEYFNQTVLLLDGDGTNGANNNVFRDSSNNNFAITRNGNTTQGTFSPFSVNAGEWSNYFDGTGDCLSFADNAAFDVGSGDFTIEYWGYVTGTGEYRSYGQIDSVPDLGTLSTFGGINSSNKAIGGFRSGSTDYACVSSADFPRNQWVHHAVVRDGATLRQYINGVQDGTAAVSTLSAINSAASFSIGRIGDYSFFHWLGYISNFRFVKGTCLYPSGTSFTPPASLTAVSGTSLLTCQSNRFVDNSSNAFAITRNGDVKVTPFSPFAPTAAYSASVNGGSGYFDGSGDYLTVPAGAAFAPGTGDFTIEAWIYPTAGVDRYIWTQTVSGANYFVFAHSSTTAYLTATASGGGVPIFGPANSLNLNSWNHVAAVRSSGTVTVYVNGAAGTGTTNTTNLSDTTRVPTIGTYTHSTSASPFTGYMSSLRYVNGTAIIPPSGGPTAPLTAVSGTSFLCNFTNAGIFDNTGKNNLETVGNAQVDTTTKKYGTGSLEFDGTGDWLKVPNSVDIQLGTGDFTIEFWVYLATGDTGSNRGLVAKGGASTGWLVSLNTTEKVVFTYTTSTITSSGAITTNSWNHIAVVREGTGSNETKIYIGGTNDGTGTVSTNFNQTEVMYIGANRAAGDPMKGYIDDLRITKGVARYTANFTPPGGPFQNL